MAPIEIEMLAVKSYAVPFTDEPNGKDVPNITENTTINNNDGFISISGKREEARASMNDVMDPLYTYSYNLDRYSKNIMVIIHDNSYGSYVATEDIKRAFGKYRFEIEVYPNMTGDQVKTFCADFFERDFAEYGAVAFAVLGPITILPKPKVKRYRRQNVAVKETTAREYALKPAFDSQEILKYFSWTTVPQTLRYKPKIFIGQMTQVKNKSLHYNPDVKVSFAEYDTVDITELWMDDQPLRLLCNRLEALGAQKSFQEIIDDVMDETKKLCWERNTGRCCKWGLISPISERIPINFCKST